jgi:hypothetical protein
LEEARAIVAKWALIIALIVADMSLFSRCSAAVFRCYAALFFRRKASWIRYLGEWRRKRRC